MPKMESLKSISQGHSYEHQMKGKSLAGCSACIHVPPREGISSAVTEMTAGQRSWSGQQLGFGVCEPGVSQGQPLGRRNEIKSPFRSHTGSGIAEPRIHCLNVL